MEYLKCHWIHFDDEYPIFLYSELGEDRYETRKIEIYRDGHFGLASKEFSFGGSELGEAEVPQIAEINQDEEFEAQAIDQAEFEELWEKYTTLMMDQLIVSRGAGPGKSTVSKNPPKANQSATNIEMRLTGYLWLIIVKIFFFSSLITIIITMLMNARENSSLERNQANFIEYVAEAIWIFCLTICVMPVHFNHFKSVRTAALLSLATFLALPLAVVITTIFISDVNRGHDFLLFYFSTSVFFIILIYFFLSFRQELNQ